jgi:HPr kinase/phosphorylase
MNVAVHASAAARNGAGVLILGAPGAGKSDLLLRLIHGGFDLVADDQVQIAAGVASAPAILAGLIEVRGLGLLRLPHVSARLVLVVELGFGERLPEARRYDDLDLPMISVDGGAASAPHRIAMALDCLSGKIPMVAGAFV